MPADPAPGHLVALDLLVQGLPQLDVLDGLFVGRHPASALPVRQPLGHALHHVLRVRVDGDDAGALERAQAFNDRQQLHAVVGGLEFAAVHGFFVAARAHQHAPAPRTRIALAGAIGPHFHFLIVRFVVLHGGAW
ncbi:hypothetical protein G6F22_015828 [Rhizopus arrhizus]|nr:hypothetical protein G6F22_015828 [Rhizopus arrhizus]